jgi:hypothetical protein
MAKTKGKDVPAKKSPPAKPLKKREEDKLVEYVAAGSAKLTETLTRRLTPLVDPARPASELAHLYSACRVMAETLGTAAKIIGDAVNTLGLEMIPQAFENEDITTTTIATPIGAYRITVGHKYVASIKAKGDPVAVFNVKRGAVVIEQFLSKREADAYVAGNDALRKSKLVSVEEGGEVGPKDAAKIWLRTHGLGDIIVETINAGTLAATGKAMLEEGRELPEDYFNCHVLPQTSMTKVK